MQFVTAYPSYALNHSTGQIVYDFTGDGLTDLILFPTLFNQGSELAGKAFAVANAQVSDVTASTLPVFTTGFVKDWFVADLSGSSKPDLLLIDHGLELPQSAGGFQNGFNRLLIGGDGNALSLDGSIAQLPRNFYHSGAVGDYLGTGKSQILFQQFPNQTQTQTVLLLQQDASGAYLKQSVSAFANYAYIPGAVATVHATGLGHDLLALGSYVTPDGATGKKSISLWDFREGTPSKVAAWDYPAAFDAPSQGAFKIIAGDFRNTGHDDLIVLLESVDLSTNYSRSWVYLAYDSQKGLTDMTAQALGSYAAPRTIDEFKVADVNNDGHADLVGFSFDNANFGNNKQILLNDGEGHFSWMNTKDISSDQGVFIAQMKQSGSGAMSDLQGFFKVTLTGGQSAAVDYIALPSAMGTGPAYADASQNGAPGFNETYYLSKHPDVAIAVANGTYSSGLDHYLKAGKAMHYQTFAAGTHVVGGSSIDVLAYQGSRADYVVTDTGTGVAVAAKGSSGRPDTLVGIERINFSDAMLALDIAGNGGQAYRLYQAAFDRKPDSAGLGYWIAQLDKGASVSDAANGFMNSPEFQNLFGTNAPVDQFVARLYQNVLHRPGEAAGVAYWTQELNSAHLSRADVLVGFSESPENEAQVLGSIQNGFQYTPLI